MKILKKSKSDKVISGVCGGIAEYIGVPAIVIRLLFIFTPISIIIYAILDYSLTTSKNLY